MDRMGCAFFRLSGYFGTYGQGTKEKRDMSEVLAVEKIFFWRDNFAGCPLLELFGLQLCCEST
jgi:hypothetical protein